MTDPIPPMAEFHDADGHPLPLQQPRYGGPGDDELPLPSGTSHVWTEGVTTSGDRN